MKSVKAVRKCSTWEGLESMDMVVMSRDVGVEMSKSRIMKSAREENGGWPRLS